MQGHRGEIADTAGYGVVVNVKVQTRVKCAVPITSTITVKSKRVTAPRPSWVYVLGVCSVGVGYTARD